MASGDPIVITQEAGNGNTFSYTATTDIVITSYGGQGTFLNFNTWVNSTSGVYSLLSKQDSTAQNVSQFNKLVIKSGQTLTADDVDVNIFGYFLSGFEL